MVHNAAGESDSLDNHFREAAASKLSIANNVITKRREQLKQWEESEMNKLAAVRQPIDRSKVKFHDSDVFMSVCDSGDEEEIDDLLGKGANINTTTIDGVTALHQAVIDGKIDTIKLLLDKGADIDAQDYEGWTPLHAAVCCGSLPIVKLLCEKGADLTFVNSDKELAVDLAEDDEIKEYLEDQLKEQNIDVEECRDREFNTMMKDCTEWIRCGKYLDKPHPRTGATALHVAASKGYNQLIGMLIRAGANVQARDAEGWTPLHAAAHWGEKDACRILMENGAKLGEKNYADQDVLRVADKSIIEYLENIQKSVEKSTKPVNVHVSQSASHVLQPTTNTTPMQLKRSSVPRLSTDEKINIKKKDEHDENLSLALGIDVPLMKNPTSPPPLSSPSPVALTALKVDSPERSTSPPPPKKPTLSSDPANPPESGNLIYKNYKQEKSDSDSSLSSQQSNPSVAAVLPAPRVSNQESVSYSSNSSIVKSGSNSSVSSSTSSVARISTVQPASPSMTSAILATQKFPPAPISRTQKVVQIPTTSDSRAPMGEEEDLEDEEDDEQLNTGSGVSSIRDYSRSITKDSSSNIYSSDQSIDSSKKSVESRPERSSSSVVASSSTPKPYWTASYGMASSKNPPVVSSSASNVANARVASPAASENSGNSPLTSPTVQFRKPISQNLIQRSASSPTNAPWVAHVKSGISNVSKNVQAFNNHHPHLQNHLHPRPPPGPRPIQTSPSYQRYSAQIRSWQTPPTQPVPQKESEAERKAKSRLQRQSRRSTQGVTVEQLNEARAASEDIGKWRSSTLQQTAVINSASKRSDDEGISSGTTHLSVSQPTDAINTPSANKYRRSQIVRANRRGTGPVDYEALSAAAANNSDEADSNDNKFANVTVRKKSDDKTFTTPSKTISNNYGRSLSPSPGPSSSIQKQLSPNRYVTNNRLSPGPFGMLTTIPSVSYYASSLGGSTTARNYLAMPYYIPPSRSRSLVHRISNRLAHSEVLRSLPQYEIKTLGQKDREERERLKLEARRNSDIGPRPENMIDDKEYSPELVNPKIPEAKVSLIVEKKIEDNPIVKSTTPARIQPPPRVFIDQPKPAQDCSLRVVNVTDSVKNLKPPTVVAKTVATREKTPASFVVTSTVVKPGTSTQTGKDKQISNPGEKKEKNFIVSNHKVTGTSKEKPRLDALKSNLKNNTQKVEATFSASVNEKQMASDARAFQIVHELIRIYQESQKNATSVIHGPVVANPPRVVSGGIATISSSTNGSVQNGSPDRYKQLYEKEREENEKLRKKLEQMNLKSGDVSNGTSRSNSATDDNDRRALERKIAQLEYELETAMKQASESARLKSENDALIRVLSKLSRQDRPAPRLGMRDYYK